MMAHDDMPLLPGFLPAPPKAPKIAGDTKGKIGEAALMMGVGSKGDDVDLYRLADCPDFPTDRLLPVPDPLGSGWTPAIVTAKLKLVDRLVAIGDYVTANRWVENMARPKSPLCDIEALTRMTAVMERQAAAKLAVLEPVEPDVIYQSLDEVMALRTGNAGPLENLPAPIGGLVLAAINDRLRRLARAGYRNTRDTGIYMAPRAIAVLGSEIGGLTGSTVRVINQVTHLLKVSRQGQTAHRPMTLDRRVLLVDDALAQLAEHLKVIPWTCASLNLVTDEIRAAWRSRATSEPLPEPFARNLFEWSADPTKANPVTLTTAELLRGIQEDPDLAYVELLRTERNRRNGL